MKKYLVVYLGGATEFEKSQPIDEKSQQGFMAKWENWAIKYKGSVIDFGCPLGKTKSVNRIGVSDKKIS